MTKAYKKDINLIIAVAIIGQLVFAFYSPGFLRPEYINRIYATTGVQHEQEDLQKLNEAAHYFGQTIIGWLKFPSFADDLSKAAALPEGSKIFAQIQERQNIIFTLSTPVPIEMSKLMATKEFIQEKMNLYNSVSRTKFVLTNLDYEQIKDQKTYIFGAIVTLLISVTAGIALAFIRREFT